MQIAKRAALLRNIELKHVTQQTMTPAITDHFTSEYGSYKFAMTHQVQRFKKNILLASLLASQTLLMGSAYALTVEPIRVKSALGEPFRAELVISDIAGVSPASIQVGLASDAEFMQLGINKKKATSDLRFSTKLTSPERGVITITSDHPLNDPYIEFLVHIGFGNNVRLQQVTALVDPPLTRVQTESMNLPVQKIELAETQPSSAPADPLANTPAVDPTAAATSPLIASNDAPPAMEGDGTTGTSSENATAPVSEPSQTASAENEAYTVQRNDSLWAIATRMQKDLNRPIPVIMRSIQQLNKAAFIGGNPNQIKNGAVLALPTQQSIEQESPPVNQAVRIENEDTESNKAPTIRPRNEQTATSKSKFVRRGHLPDAKMTLVAPTQQGDIQGGATQGNSEAEQKKLTAINSKITVSRQKNIALNQEINLLETQIKANEQKLALQNAKLADLMQRLKNRKEAAPQHRN